MSTPAPGSRVLAGVIFFGLIIGAIVWFNASSAHRDTTDDTATLNRIRAEQTCQDLVRDNLKAPSTASFSDMDTSATGVTIAGHVDAQNSFGAMIRNSFVCTVDLDTHTVTLLKLSAGQ